LQNLVFLPVSALTIAGGIAENSWISIALGAAGGLYTLSSLNPDDLVGVINLGSSCFPQTLDPVTFPLNAPGEAPTGTMTLDLRGVVRDSVCGQPSPSPITVTISGPKKVQPGVACTWMATVTGASPYFYTWWRDGQIVSQTAEYSGEAAPMAFELELNVNTGFVGGHAAWTVITSSSAPPCLE